MCKSAHSVNGMSISCLLPSVHRHRTYCNTLICRLNTKLESNGHPPMTSLVKDLSDGVRLIQLMVSMPPEADCNELTHGRA